MPSPQPSHPLDNPPWQSLLGAHARFAESVGEAVRYQSDVAPFAALPDDPSPTYWNDLVALVGAGHQLLLVDGPPDVPSDWTMLGQTQGVQLTGDDLDVEPYPEAIVLGPADVPEMIELVERTKPGPFRVRTIELGRYLGVRVDGELIAMAGERLNPPGWVEISAVCTDERFRGSGYASRLIRAVGHGIRERGNVPFLHASAQNVNALRLYESMGFSLRREVVFTAWRLPA